MKIDSDAIRELADLLNETGLTEVEVAEGDQVIRVSKANTIMAGGAGSAQPVMTSDPAIPQQANTNTAAPQASASAHPGAIKSPMVGTIYLQPEPNAATFFKKGDHVNAGDTLLIIEAMKVMNPIKAETSGTLTQVLVSNGDPVEYGDVLMIIE